MHVNSRRHFQPLKEIQRLGQLSRTWQRNLPDEQRPAFEQAQLKLIDQYVRRGERARFPKQDPIEIHNGLMHEHDSRSARVLDRTLHNGIIPHAVARSFRDGSREDKIDEPHWRRPVPMLEQRAHLPSVDVFLQHKEDTHEVGYFNHKSGAFVPQQSDFQSHIEVKPIR